VGFVVDKAELGQLFTEYFGFSYQSFHRLLHTHHHPSSRAGTIGRIVADVPPQPKKQKKKKWSVTAVLFERMKD
jgi:hypothetical protein